VAAALLVRLDAQAPPAAPATGSAAADQHAGHGQEPAGNRPPDGSRVPAPQEQAGTSEEPPRGLPGFIPPLTEEDRAAAFPDVEAHAVHDRGVHSFVLFDQLEWQAAAAGSGFNLDGKGWIGGDRSRVWVRAEGERAGGRTAEAQAHVLYARQFSRWWDIVGGIRQDFRPGPAQTWAAVGIQGLAPHWFDVEATAYLGASGRTHARFEVEYELLLTNHVILQPLVEAEVFGKSDPERGVGAGLSTTDVGLRLRYAFRPDIAPYAGVVWRNEWGKTADFSRADGEETGGARLVAGVRLWF
jgi:copper resistance protein B